MRDAVIYVDTRFFSSNERSFGFMRFGQIIHKLLFMLTGSGLNGLRVSQDAANYLIDKILKSKKSYSVSEIIDMVKKESEPARNEIRDWTIVRGVIGSSFPIIGIWNSAKLAAIPVFDAISLTFLILLILLVRLLPNKKLSELMIRSLVTSELKHLGYKFKDK